MGQSIQKPKRNSSLRNSRIRQQKRSYLRYSSQQRQSSGKNSRGGSIVQQNNMQKNQLFLSHTAPSYRNSELGLVSKYEQNKIGLKKQNQIKGQRISIGGQGSLLSPNFRQLNQIGAQYGLLNVPTNNTSNKPALQTSHNRDHHNDMTISFRNPQNLVANHFQDESQQKKQSLRKILQDSVQHQQNNVKSHFSKNASQYLQQQIDKISSNKSFCSDHDNKINESLDNKYAYNNHQQIQQKVQKTKENNLSKIQQKIKMQQQLKYQKQSKIKIKQQVKVTQQQLKILNDTLQYNDYDLISFSNSQQQALRQSRKIKLSKKMQELKAKLAKKIVTDTKTKQQILKNSSRRLSKSLQKTNSDNSQDKSLERAKYKNVFSKIKNNQEIKDSKVNMFLNEVKKQNNKKNNDQYQFIRNDQVVNKDRAHKKDNKDNLKASGCQSKQSDYTFQNKKVQQTNKILMFGNKNSLSYQNPTQNTSKPSIQIDIKKSKNSKTKQQQTFTQMVKKQHYSNKNKKSSHNNLQVNQLKLSHVQHNKFSPVAQSLFASTCNQKQQNKNQYQFFDENDNKKYQNVDKQFNKKQQLLSLKNITHKLTNKQSKQTSKNKVNEEISSSQQQSFRNKTYYQKNSFNNDQNRLNYTQVLNYQEYMIKDALNRQRQSYEWGKNQRKKHKSLDNKSKVSGVKRVKLLVF